MQSNDLVDPDVPCAVPRPLTLGSPGEATEAQIEPQLRINIIMKFLFFRDLAIIGFGGLDGPRGRPDPPNSMISGSRKQKFMIIFIRSWVLSYSGGCIQNQPRRPVLKPLRGHVLSQGERATKGV